MRLEAGVPASQSSESANFESAWVGACQLANHVVGLHVEPNPAPS